MVQKNILANILIYNFNNVVRILKLKFMMIYLEL